MASVCLAHRGKEPSLVFSCSAHKSSVYARQGSFIVGAHALAARTAMRLCNGGGARDRVLTTRALRGPNHPLQPEHTFVLRLLIPCNKVGIVLRGNRLTHVKRARRLTRCFSGGKGLLARERMETFLLRGLSARRYYCANPHTTQSTSGAETCAPFRSLYHESTPVKWAFRPSGTAITEAPRAQHRP
jgi:hypothetical protein